MNNEYGRETGKCHKRGWAWTSTRILSYLMETAYVHSQMKSQKLKSFYLFTLSLSPHSLEPVSFRQARMKEAASSPFFDYRTSFGCWFCRTLLDGGMQSGTRVSCFPLICNLLEDTSLVYSYVDNRSNTGGSNANGQKHSERQFLSDYPLTVSKQFALIQFGNEI